MKVFLCLWQKKCADESVFVFVAKEVADELPSLNMFV